MSKLPIHPGRVLFQDDHLLAVQKLSGELSVAADSGRGKKSLFDLLHEAVPGLRAVHRLDFYTSGVIVFAKTKEAETAIREGKFAQWEKVYRAIVAGHFREKKGVIDKPLAARTVGKSVDAQTQYRVVCQFAQSADVEARIEHGRRHQIRKHFAHIGHPLLLDDEYGNQKINRAVSRATRFHHFFLHAISLSFPHPITGEKVAVHAPLPLSYVKMAQVLSHKS